MVKANKGFAYLVKQAAADRKAKHQEILETMNRLSSGSEDKSKAISGGAASYTADGTANGTTVYPTDGTTAEKITPRMVPRMVPPFTPPKKTTDGTASYPADGTTVYPTDGTASYSANGTTDYPTDGTASYPANGTTDYPTDGTASYSANGTTDYPTDATTGFYSSVESVKIREFFLNNNSLLSGLTDNQILIINWLADNIHNPASCQMIADATGISKNTVKKCLPVLVKYNLISPLERYAKGKFQGFKCGLTKKIVTQSDGTTVYPTDKTHHYYNKKERFFLKNLSYGDFWLKHISQQKFEEWSHEFDFSKEIWEEQLSYGANHPDILNADDKAAYFYICLKRGGLTRPTGFEFPEERRLRLQEERLREREVLLKKAEALREKERDIADREALQELLKNQEAVSQAIGEFEAELAVRPSLRISVQKFRSSGAIDMLLENRLKRWLMAQAS